MSSEEVISMDQVESKLEATEGAVPDARTRSVSQLFDRDIRGERLLPNIRSMLKARIANEDQNLAGNAARKAEAQSMAGIVVRELLAKLKWTPPQPSDAGAADSATMDGYLEVLKALTRVVGERGAALCDVNEHSKSAIVEQMLDAATSQNLLAADKKDAVRAAVEAREAEFPEAIGDTFNVLLGTDASIQEPAVVFVRLTKPANFDAPDGLPTRFFWLLLGGSDDAARDQLIALGEAIALFMSDSRFHDTAVHDCGTKGALVSLCQSTTTELELALKAAGDDAGARTRAISLTSPGPKGKGGDAAGADNAAGAADASAGKKASAWTFPGVRRDFNNRVVKFYRDEWRDPFNGKTIAATLFLFWACITPAIAFGALHSELTSDWIGIIETMASTAVIGILYSFMSGMPLMIIGGTGPIVIFTGILFQLTEAMDINFLATRWWVSFWCLIFSLYLAAAETCNVVRFITKFTDEIFAGLISVIFIVSAIKPLVGYFSSTHDSDAEVDANGNKEFLKGQRKYNDAQALLSLTIAICTCWMILTLRSVRKSIFLRGGVRAFLADFSSIIAIVFMTFCDKVMLPGVKPPELVAPNDPSATTLGNTLRPWFVDPFEFGRIEITEECKRLENCKPGNGGGIWVIFFAILPAMLAMVLIFLDDVITWNIINSKQNKLKHGPAYHYETVVMGVMTMLAGMVGAPWLVAATVRSINHVQALAEKEEVTVHGHVHEHIRGVRETRWTGFTIHLLILCALFFLMPAVKLVPMPVLHGVFLFMGIASLNGNSFIERFKLFFQEPALYPPTHYIRNVPTTYIMQFTAWQVAGFVVLYVVKSLPYVAVGFPCVIMLFIPLRLKVLPKYIPMKFIEILDSHGDDEHDDDEVQ